MFEELPIANIKATHNNTHIHFTDCAGVHISRTSCGAEGFKNAKKSSTIAAQVTGIAAAKKAKLNGINFVRVLVKGLGPGRLPFSINALKVTDGLCEPSSHLYLTPTPLGGNQDMSAIKGLSIGGLEIVSITDNTPVPHNGCRPRKARRI
ncbi:hypothetical protein DNTS_028174 [Danionella cerebrum]|uniref:Ribosomal protein S11 n=1 Tax=Danionella cerebrum TaxID=2873325 RepID=A0A553QRA7_9TELE|nr:hypothetical protein DNTS_028174 [Danionella translucida]